MREADCLQDRKYRTSCCPWVVVKFWNQFVFYIATAGLNKYIFKYTSQVPATERSDDRAPGKLARFSKNQKLK